MLLFSRPSGYCPGTHTTPADTILLQHSNEHDKALTPFKSPTNCAQGDKVVTGNTVMSVVHIVKAEMLLLHDKFTIKFVTAFSARREMM